MGSFKWSWCWDMFNVSNFKQYKMKIFKRALGYSILLAFLWYLLVPMIMDMGFIGTLAMIGACTLGVGILILIGYLITS